MISSWTKIRPAFGIVSAVSAGSLCEQLHAIQCIGKGFRCASFCVQTAASGTCGVQCHGHPHASSKYLSCSKSFALTHIILCRVVEGGLEMAPNACRLLPIEVTITRSIIYHGWAIFLHRALEGGLEMLPNGFRLLPVVPVECYERKAKGIEITSIFAAVETNPADKFSIGALGQWLLMPDLLQRVWQCKQETGNIVCICSSLFLIV